jgi:hypothetical protein
LEKVGGDFLASRIGGLNCPISVSVGLTFSCKRSLSSCYFGGGGAMDANAVSWTTQVSEVFHVMQPLSILKSNNKAVTLLFIGQTNFVYH